MSEPERLVKTRPTGRGRARGLVSSRVSGARIDAQTYAVPDDLAGLVMSFWVGRWDLEGQPPHVTELLGDPSVHFAFEASDATASSDAGARIVGVWTDLWVRELAGRGCVRGVKLRPGAFRAFVDASAGEYSDRKTPWNALFHDPDGAQIAARMLTGIDEPRDDAAAFDAMARWLRARLRRGELDDVRLAVALVARATEDPAITTVDGLARAGGVSVRPLQRLFRLHVGATPKWTIRRARLQEVAVRLEAGEVVSLAALAAELGYTDQSHLARDFKRATGKTPSQFAETVWT